MITLIRKRFPSEGILFWQKVMSFKIEKLVTFSFLLTKIENFESE